MTIVNDTKEDNKRIITVEEIGNRRKEVEEALQRAFNRETAKVRAGLVATDLADLNPNHPHSQTYIEMAEEMDISVMDTGDGENPLVKVIIEE